MTSLLPDVERSLVQAAARGRRRRRAPILTGAVLAVAALAVALLVTRVTDRPAPPVHRPTPTPTATPAPVGPPVSASEVVARLARTYKAFRQPPSPVPKRFRRGDLRGAFVEYDDQARLLAEQDGWRAYAIPAAFGAKAEVCTLVVKRDIGGGGCGELPRPAGWNSTYLGRGRYLLVAELLPNDAVTAQITRLDGHVDTVPVQRNAAIFPPGPRARRYSWIDRAGTEHGKLLDPRLQ